MVRTDKQTRLRNPYNMEHVDTQTITTQKSKLGLAVDRYMYEIYAIKER